MKTLLTENLYLLPPVVIYSTLLNEACFKFKITTTEARKRYGLFSCKQWIELLF